MKRGSLGIDLTKTNDKKINELLQGLSQSEIKRIKKIIESNK